jgi:membrane fusion protein, multidrug efflux system
MSFPTVSKPNRCLARAAHRRTASALGVSAFALLLAACQPESEAAAPEVRPVRTLTVETREAGVPITLTGRIEAEDEAAIAFRISGRLLENNNKLGDRVEPGQVIARLEPQNELNALRAAQANLAAAQGRLTEVKREIISTARTGFSGMAGQRGRTTIRQRRRCKPPTAPKGR